MADEDEIKKDDGSCSSDVGEVAESGVGEVAGPACQADSYIVERKSLDSG